MKKTFLATLMAFVSAAFLFTSCTKENSDLIIGTWDVDLAATYETYTEGGVSQTMYVAEEGCTAASLTFKENGIVTFSSTYEGEGTETFDGPYTIDGDKLMLDGEDCRILKLNNKKLILEMSETDEEDGVSFSYAMHMELDRR